MSDASDEDPPVEEEAMEWLSELGLADFAAAFASNYGLRTKEDFEDYGAQCDLDEMNMPRALQRMCVQYTCACGFAFFWLDRLPAHSQHTQSRSRPGPGV